MVFQTTADFKTFYEAGLAVEDALRTGIFDKGESTTKPKRAYSGNSNTLFGSNNYHQAPASSSKTKPTKAEPVNQIITQPAQPKREFHQFPFSPVTAYKKLLEKGAIKPLEPRELAKELPASHNPNVYCAYHQMPGHHTNNCIRLRHKIQDLIDNGTLPIPKPNTISNPMPEHKPNAQLNQITISSTINGQSSTKYDPSQYIIPATEPKPIVLIPVDSEVCVLENTKPKWGDVVETSEWAMNDDEWEELRLELADPLDGFSVCSLFERSEWDPMSTEWQFVEDAGLSAFAPDKFIIPDFCAKPMVEIPMQCQVCRIDRVVCAAGMIHTIGYVDPAPRVHDSCVGVKSSMSPEFLFDSSFYLWPDLLMNHQSYVTSTCFTFISISAMGSYIPMLEVELLGLE